MILEQTVEDKIASCLSALPELSACQVVCSRSGDKGERDDIGTVVAVAAGFRQHDAFSLSPISMAMSLTIMTRVEDDKTAVKHNAVVEAVADKLSWWHKHGDDMEADLTTDKCAMFELKMDGGTSIHYDQSRCLWTDTIQFTARGAEIFNN